MLNKLENELLGAGLPFIRGYIKNGDERIFDYIDVIKRLEILGVVNSDLSVEFLSEIRDYREHDLKLSTLYVDVEALTEPYNSTLLNRFKKLLNEFYDKKILTK